MAEMTMKLDKRFYKKVQGRFQKYTFEVGILEDGPHKDAKSKKEGFKSLAGGDARKVGRSSSKTISEVSAALREHTGVNFYTKPFKAKSNKELITFMKRFFQNTNGGNSDLKRIENALQAVVRNPIVRGEYGQNSKLTEKIKGFNRLMIDTGQLFKAIKARVKLRRV